AGAWGVHVRLPGLAQRGLRPVPGHGGVAGLPVAPQLKLDFVPRAALVARVVGCLPAVAVVWLVIFPAPAGAGASARARGAVALLPVCAVARGYVFPAG